MLNEQRQQRAAEPANVVDLGTAASEIMPALIASQVTDCPSSADEPTSEPVIAANLDIPMSQEPTVYQTTDYSEFSDRIDPENFHNESYDATLQELMRLTLGLEAPIAADLLVQRIARAHDFKRSGRLIRERVLDLADDHFHLREDPINGSFVWLHAGGPGTMTSFRISSEGEVARSIEEIPCEEILAAALHAGVECSASQIARTFGNKRLTAPGKERIDRAIELLEERRRALTSAAGRLM
jgi:hypothetical protein